MRHRSGRRRAPHDDVHHLGPGIDHDRGRPGLGGGAAVDDLDRRSGLRAGGHDKRGAAGAGGRDDDVDAASTLRDLTHPEDGSAREVAFLGAIFAIAGVLLFNLVEDVLARGELMRADQAISGLVGSWRTGFGDSLMVTITALGDTPAARGGLARQFTPDLIKLTEDGDPVIREFAARALGKINPDPQPATAALANGTSDRGFYEAKLVTARFFADKIMPETNALRRKVEAGSESLMALPAEAF